MCNCKDKHRKKCCKKQKFVSEVGTIGFAIDESPIVYATGDIIPFSTVWENGFPPHPSILSNTPNSGFTVTKTGMYTLIYNLTVSTSQYNPTVVSFDKTAGVGLLGSTTILLTDTSSLSVGMVVRDLTDNRCIKANTVITSITTNTSITISRIVDFTPVTGHQLRFYVPLPADFIFWIEVESPQFPGKPVEVASSNSLGTLYPTWDPTRRSDAGGGYITVNGSWTGPMTAGQTAVMRAFVFTELNEIYAPSVTTPDVNVLENYFTIQRIS